MRAVPHSEEGSTLVELLIAITLAGTVSVGLLSGVSALASSSDRTGRRALVGLAITSVAHRVVSGALGPYRDCGGAPGLPLRFDRALRPVAVGAAYEVEVSAVVDSVRHPDRNTWSSPTGTATFDLACSGSTLPDAAVGGIRSERIVASTADGRVRRELEVVWRR